MNQRIDVSDLELASALKMVGDALSKRIAEKGRKSFIGPHEMQGIIDEEVLEMKLAIHANDRGKTVAEMVDISVGCLFSVASVLAMMRREKEEAARAAPPPPPPPQAPPPGSFQGQFPKGGP